jgi:hypothetical protein
MYKGQQRAPICMTKEQIILGLKQGRVLCQWEFCSKEEEQWLNELIAEGIAEASPWLPSAKKRWKRVIWLKKH